MTESGDPKLSAWQTYYEIVGSSAAALIGIQFVVITLIAYMRKVANADTVSAFATPTVMHLVGALLISAIMSAPWPSLFATSIALAICGVIGLTYCAIVIRRARRQTGYQPVWEDWLWHAILPSSMYAALTAAAVFLPPATQVALFAIGASAVFVLLIGIHNAWDTVTHLVVTGSGGDQTETK